jgi:hypothetical protein
MTPSGAAVSPLLGTTATDGGNWSTADTIDGDRLVFESLEGAAARLRFTWDASNRGVITWRNEMAIDERSWFLIEEYAMVPN